MIVKETKLAGMIARGEWLERYLGDISGAKALRKLVDDGAKLIGMKYRVHPDSCFFRVLAEVKIKEGEPFLTAVAGQAAKARERYHRKRKKNPEESYAMMDPKKLEAEAMTLEYQAGRITDSCSTRVEIEKMFREILGHQKNPWGHTVRRNDPGGGLAGLYGVTHEVIVGDDDGGYEKGMVVTLKGSPIVGDSPIEMVPICEIVARIFFEFLFGGGADYFNFCHWCDKFFVVRRAGQRKYCADTCRAAATRARMANR